MRSTDKLYDIINIISFNRPIYFEEVLNSIVNQTTDYSQKSIHIWIDGYRGSLDEAKESPIARKRSHVSLKNIFLTPLYIVLQTT